MVKKKKVAIVIGRYYLTLPLIIGYNDLYDWDISVIDVGFDPTGVSSNEFYLSLPSTISKFKFSNESSLFKHLKKFHYDFVIATNIKHKDINKARMRGLISKLYVIYGAFLKPTSSLVTIETKTEIVRRSFKNRLKSLVINLLNLKYYFLFFKKQFFKIMNNKSELYYSEAYDTIFCWNQSESHYFEGENQIFTQHPFHLYLAKNAEEKNFSYKILIAHNGDPAYYTDGYNEFINSIISNFDTICEIVIKVHPLSKYLPTFNGEYKIINNVLTEDQMKKYDIFINEDSYMGVEMFFNGSYIINFGDKDASASNINFTHIWSNNSSHLIDRIKFIINNWNEINHAHIKFLKQFLNSYKSPKEFY
jgi:hypothetical protein